jgi:hypothetical protein
MNLVEGILVECKRVREVLVPAYESIGPVGSFGKAMILADLAEAEAALGSGDVVRMVAAYKALKGCQ